MNKKVFITALLALSLAVSNAAYAKQGERDDHEENHKSHKKKGLENALDHVKNPKARAAIKRALEKQKKEKEREEQTDAQIVAAVKASLVIGYSGNDNADNVTAPLKLVTKAQHESSITWVSSHPAVISHDGKTVNRPSTGTGDVQVVLTATIKKNTVTDTKQFTVVVKNQLSDIQKVAADKAALIIGYSGNDNANNVTLPLTLPKIGTNGSGIAWLSSAPSVISNDGKTVNRPANGQADATVTLIATIRSNGISDVKTFTVVVKQQLTDAQKVAADKAALAIGFRGADTVLSVTSNVILPTTGVNGSVIYWFSSSQDIISDTGSVVRPAAGQGDKSVTLTAIIINHSIVDVKTFTVIVKQLP